MTAADYIDMAQARQRLVRAMDARLASLDALVLPTTPIVAPTIAEVATPDDFGRKNAMLLRNTAMVNFFDLCAISLPLPRQGGLAAGLMLVARNGARRTPVPHRRGGREMARRLTPAACLVGLRASTMNFKFQSFRGVTPCLRIQDRRSHRLALNRRRLLAGAAATTTLLAAPAIVRAQGGALKVGVLLPRSGAQAGIGQDCHRGVELADPILKAIGWPELQIMNADTETNVEVARVARREADQRRRAAPGRRLRFRPDHGDRPGRRAEGHPASSSTSPRRRRSPSRATSSCSATSRPRR